MSKLLVIYIISCFCVTWTKATPLDDVQEILNAAIEKAKTKPGSYKNVAEETINQLLPYPKGAVTKALYEKLEIGGPLVARIARENKVFDPGLWMDITTAEGNRYVKMKALGIFSIEPRTSSDERFVAVLKESLTDTREGTHPIGDEERAYTDIGLRVCDIAYNILMFRRPEANRPGEYPLDTVGDSIATRDHLITKLCEELGIPGPTSPNAIRELPRSVTPTQNKQHSSASQTDNAIPQLLSETKTRAWFMWLLLVIAAITGAAWLFLRKRK